MAPQRYWRGAGPSWPPTSAAHGSVYKCCCYDVCLGLRVSDTALYTCRAVSDTGQTSRSAALLVRAPSNPSIVFHRTPEPSTFPGPPSKPAVSDVTASSVRLTWRPNANTGASQTHAYIVEYFSHDTDEASRRIYYDNC